MVFHQPTRKETCRLIGTGTQILTTKDIPAIEADTLDDRVLTGLWVFIPNTRSRFFKIVVVCNAGFGVDQNANEVITRYCSGQAGSSGHSS